MKPPHVPPSCVSEDTRQSRATKTAGTTRGDRCHREHARAVTAAWMVKLMGERAKELEDLLIFIFFLKKLLIKSDGIRIGYSQESLVMDMVRKARLDYMRRTETRP